jgi:hypothetical protein
MLTSSLRSRGRNRRSKRLPIYWPTTLVEGDLRRGCTILDASRIGARLRVTAPPRPHTRIMLIDDRVGALEAIVMWCKGDQAGVEFLPPEPAVMARLRALLLALEEAETRNAAERRHPQFGRRTHHGSPVK